LYTSQPGRIEAFEQTPLYPKVTGYVEEVLVDIGDVVQKDQPLVQLWIPEMENELTQKQALVAQASADVKQAEAAVAAAKAAVNSAAAQVAQAEAGIARIDAEHQRWKSEFARIEQLANDGAVTRKLLDETLHQLRAAEAARQEGQAAVQAAEAARHEAKARVTKAEADQAAAAARVDVAEANLQHTQTLIAYGTIKAPYSGVVVSRNVDTGHYVHPANGSAYKPLVTVARMDKVRVSVDVPEMEAPLIDAGAQGDRAVVRVQSLAQREFEARVTRTSWSLAESNRSLRVEIDIDNPQAALRPGMYASCSILLDERPQTLVLPIAAVIREGRDAFCCCVESGKIVRRPIQLGLRAGNEVEIVSGIDANQMVVMIRPESLVDGQLVEVISPEK
jgi:RND family efflux transporter MFP subunit